MRDPDDVLAEALWRSFAERDEAWADERVPTRRYWQLFVRDLRLKSRGLGYTLTLTPLDKSNG